MLCVRESCSSLAMRRRSSIARRRAASSLVRSASSARCSTSRRCSCHRRNDTAMTPAEISHPAADNPRRPRSVRILRAYASCPRAHRPVVPIAGYSRRSSQQSARLPADQAEVGSCGRRRGPCPPRTIGVMATTTLRSPHKTGTRGHLGVALLVIATAQLMVVLDATIVTVALPHIQTALGFSGSGLEWVVNAYVLTLGGLLLLGGRAGDLFGRRRMFILGLVLFSVASLAGGLATSGAWLLAARAVQGAGGAIVAPTALSLVATTFPEGPARNRAMGVYAAMSVAGSVIGLVAGGLLVSYVSWRWVLFVNVPFGVVAALAAWAVLPGAAPQPGRFDVLGAATGTGGAAALVYGLSTAAPSRGGASHWGDANVVAALAGGAVLLALFGVISARSPHALLPARLLRDRDRIGANLIMLGVGAALGGVFFFISLFVQEVWGYSPLRTGMSFLPLTAVMLVATGAATRLIPRLGARPLLAAGSILTAGGLYWLSLVTEHSTYAAGL